MEFKTITMPVSFYYLQCHFYILYAITRKVNLHDLATFSIFKTFQLIIIFSFLDLNHFVYKWLRKVDIKYVSGTILTSVWFHKSYWLL